MKLVLAIEYLSLKPDQLTVFKHNILNRKQFKPTKSLIKDVIKMMKKTSSLDIIHGFTLSSVTKIASLGAVLMALLFH